MLLNIALGSGRGDTKDKERFPKIIGSIVRTGPSAVADICTNFQLIASKYNVLTIYETQEVRGCGSLVRIYFLFRMARGITYSVRKIYINFILTSHHRSYQKLVHCSGLQKNNESHTQGTIAS